AAPNTPPTAVDDAISVAEDGSVTFQPGDNDLDPDAGTTIVASALVGQPSNGAAVLNPDGTVTYTPDANVNGTDSFDVTVTDGDGGFDTATVNVTIDPVDDDPIANDDTATTAEATPVIINLLANDEELDGETLTIIDLEDPANGTVIDNGNGTVTYTPDVGFSGDEAFDYTISDGDGPTSTATVQVNVTSFPTPIFDDPAPMSFDGSNADVLELPHISDYEVPEGTVAFAFTAADTSGDQGLFAKDASFFGGGGHGTIYLDGNTLVARFQDLSTSAVLEFDGILAGQEYKVATTFGAGGVELWVDGALVDSAPLPVSWLGNQEFIQWGGRGWGSDPLQPGFDAPFQGTISDKQIYGVALTATQVAELQQDAPPNTPPTLVDDVVSTDEDTAVTFDPTDNDIDPDSTTLSVQGVDSGPANGSVVINPDGTVTYTPDVDFFGNDTFDFVITDNDGNFVTSNVDVTVNPVEDDPTAADDTAETLIDTPIVIDVLDNDSDADGDDLSVAGITADPSSGSVVINPDGTVTYTPNAGFTGDDSFIYALSDGDGPTDTATAFVSVTAEPSFPTPVFSQPGLATYSGSNGDVDNYAPSSTLNIAEGTIAFSFAADNAGPRQGLVVKDASGFVGGGNHFAAYVNKDQLFVRYQDGTDSTTAQIGGISDGQEYEVATTFSSAGVELYLDGALVFEETGFVMDWTTNDEYLQVGGLGWGSDAGAPDFINALTGQIADVEIYDSVLELEEIQQLAATS
ncbi:MAG: tandem-95 repeat protein, partial [Planctomycetota bacterium]